MFVEDLNSLAFRVYTSSLNMKTPMLESFFRERFTFDCLSFPDFFDFSGVVLYDLKRSRRVYIKLTAPLCLISDDNIETIRLVVYQLVSQDGMPMIDGLTCQANNETRERLQPNQHFQTKLYTKQVPCRFFLSFPDDVEIDLKRLLASSSDRDGLKRTLRGEVRPDNSHKTLYRDRTYVIDPLYQFETYQDLLQQETISNALFRLNLN